MLVRFFWRNCNNLGRKWGAGCKDAFWIEATEEEAEMHVYPYLPPPAIEESRNVAEQYMSIAELIGGNPIRPFCFLVARDVSSIDPYHVHYPFHQLWNGYSPFEMMPEMIIESLEELRNIELPPKETREDV